MEDKELIRKKAVSWLNRKYYPPRKINHFRVIGLIFSGVVLFMSLLIYFLVEFGQDIDLYFSSMRAQLYLIVGVISVLFGFTVWFWFRRYRNF